MAQVTGGGGKSAVMPNFDPKTFTLKQAINSYAEASRKAGSKLEGFEKRLEGNKVITQYLDRPVVDLFDGHMYQSVVLCHSLSSWLSRLSLGSPRS